MCGIVGAYGAHPQKLDVSLAALGHRGPDGSALQHYDSGVLGHARLAIIDVDGGHQPLRDSSGARWLICNGEIYNHERLRAAYGGYPFQTLSDSEAILAAYAEHGPDAVRRLDGMFAFALLDGDGLLLARDRLGIKPLYYGEDGDTLYFASEIKALQGVVPDIHEFPPGTWYSPAHGFQTYYDVATVAEQAVDQPNPALDDLRLGLRRAVEKRLMSDVPLGVFLSGGLDSSIIAALVCESLDGVHSFAVGMAGSADLDNARHAARFLGTHHHEYIYTTEEMVAILPDVIYYLESFDPALVRSAIPNYFLARLAREYVTVVLSGEGADELYSGYSYLKQFPDSATLQRELIHITAELHNRNLQRLDRMTMAHGLEGRVPFLDVDFLALSFAVPIEQKLRGPEQVEKWALRKAFEGILPPEIAWRAKEKFSAGAGSAHVFAQLADQTIPDAEFAAEAHAIERETGCHLDSKEALYYYRIFQAHFGASLAALVGRSRSL